LRYSIWFVVESLDESTLEVSNKTSTSRATMADNNRTIRIKLNTTVKRRPPRNIDKFRRSAVFELKFEINKRILLELSIMSVSNHQSDIVFNELKNHLQYSTWIRQARLTCKGRNVEHTTTIISLHDSNSKLYWVNDHKAR
jgi:hypothetical protein